MSVTKFLQPFVAGIVQHIMRKTILPLAVIAVCVTGCQWFDRQRNDPPKPQSTASLGESIDLTTPVAPATMPAAPAVNPMLLNTTWTLAELGGQPAMAVEGARPATIQFVSEQSRLIGSTGVNRFSGTYALGAGTVIKLEPGAMTRMAGAPLLMQQEAKLIDALRITTGYRIEGGSLDLLSGDRVVARYMKVDETKP
jgi:heat shock protein HslJ